MAQAKKGTRSKTTAKKKGTQNTSDKSILAAVCCFVLALLLILFFFVNSEAPINRMFKKFLMGLFGSPSVLIPFILMIFGVYLIKIRDTKKAIQKAILVFVTLSAVSAFVHLSETDMVNFSNSYSSASKSSVGESFGGGLFGACIALPLFNLFGRAAAFVVLSVILLVLVSYISECSIISLAMGLGHGIYEFFRNSSKTVDKEKDYKRGIEMTEKLSKKRQEKQNSMSAGDILSEMKDADLRQTKQIEFEDEKITAGNDKIKSIKKKKKKIEESAEAARDEGFSIMWMMCFAVCMMKQRSRMM